MEKKFLLIMKIVTWIIMGLGVVLLLLVLLNGDNLAKVTEESVNSPILNNYLYLTFIALGIAIIVTIIFPIINAVTHPKKALKGLLVIAAFVVVGLISYLLAKGDSSFSVQELNRLNTTDQTVMLVGASIYFTYIICAATIIVTILSPVFKHFKK